ncbi:YheC/YheD family endospore coat-associated protein [Alteribacillus iranensis]|uniref:YheC/D like ATP-grasp n=1 Tax=Alteribacillus iranensis TaxID=930128 RepID=A0A1I1ZFQ7_9BACI|nr:YheC/YheD family protein [Alteribacillus iranensis]SFE30539.1 YheC/D like ATP-grasp [Alteribacillus iranensis]
MVWIKIKTSQQDGHALYIPSMLIDVIPSTIHLTFGKRTAEITVKTMEDFSQKTHSFNHPTIVYMTQSLLNQLLIIKDIPYQLRFKKEQWIIGPVIGLLLGEQQDFLHPQLMNRFTNRLTAYSQIGGLIIAFKDQPLHLEKECIYGLYYSPNEKTWLPGKFPLPSAVYRRTFRKNHFFVNQLHTIVDGNIFNSVRLTKWETYQLLRKEPMFEKYLPETVKITSMTNIKKFVSKHRDVILKPANSSQARGILIIKRISKDSFYLLDYRRKKDSEAMRVTDLQLWELLRREHIIHNTYIAQPYIKLANIHGTPWDIRVVMQRNRKKQWECHGIECRLAKKNQFITNISRGGTGLTIKEAVTFSFGEPFYPIIKENVKKAAYAFCQVLDKTNEHFAEIGLDFACDTDKNVWFIEVNTKPSFQGFQSISEKNYSYLSTAPLHYAASLAGF